MDLSWLPLLALGIGLYFLWLSAYRLWAAVRRLFQAFSRTALLVGDIQNYEHLDPSPKTPATSEDLTRLLAERRKLSNRRRKLRVDRQRRLINRIRDIETDKRWA